MKCNKCGSQLPQNAKFCNKCGEATRTMPPKPPPATTRSTQKSNELCLNCGKPLYIGERSCRECGTSVKVKEKDSKRGLLLICSFVGAVALSLLGLLTFSIWAIFLAVGAWSSFVFILTKKT